jgi:cation diffusion facilitator family transporter
MAGGPAFALAGHRLSMHSDHLAPFECPRDFGDIPLSRERGARLVVGLTAGMMVLELVVGYWSRSLALTADGWHMGTHAGALGLTALAYWFARTRSEHRSFSFGTGKVHALAGFTNAVILGIVALTMIYEGAERLLVPATIRYREALPIAVLGLVVNLVCYRVLHRTRHDADHDHDHDHDHPSSAHHDHGHRAALLHVAADALTSVAAIVALALGMGLGWGFLDPLMGVVGGALVLKWAVGLCRSAGRQLLDATASESLEAEVKALLERIDDVRVADIHSWEVGPGRRACIVSLLTSYPRDVAEYRERILERWPFAHLNIEIHRCRAEHPPAPSPSA